MAPNYTRPEAPVPSGWPGGPAYKDAAAIAGDRSAADIKWQEFIVHEQLQKLIALALNNNRDLRIAALNIERSQALYRIQRADLFPTVMRRHHDRIGIRKPRCPGESVRCTSIVSISGSPPTSSICSVACEALRIRRWRSSSPRKRRVAAQISLIAEVAGSYLALAADKERLTIARDTFESQKASYSLIKRRFEAGASSELDLRQAQTSVDSARVDIARFTSQVAQDENALAVVIGSPVPADLMPEGLSEITALKELSAGLPSEVLLRRPDIMQTEHLLKAANANIGAARAAFFPRIALTSTIGLSSDQLSGLFDGGAGAWGFAPAITLPIFDAGRNRANLKVSEVDREIFQAQYERAIQAPSGKWPTPLRSAAPLVTNLRLSSLLWKLLT
jgi:multidrug efflux system outer membrane protein